MQLETFPARIKIPKGFRIIKNKESLIAGDFWARKLYNCWCPITTELRKAVYGGNDETFIRKKINS